jgi:Na+/proline symporter
MLTRLTPTELFFVLLVMIAGIAWYVRIARRDARLLTEHEGENGRWRLKNFFLAGGTLGSNLTENNTLGMTFAWAGGTWFFAWTAYSSGPLVLLFQIPWCISVIALGLLVPRIITKIRGRTIHGFLGEHYGNRTQRVAAVATSIGYFVNAGYELFFPSLLFALTIGDESFGLPIAIGMGAVVASYCTIGGYRSNATVDKPHNILGVLALAILVVGTCLALRIAGPVLYAAIAFAVGSTIYVLVSSFSSTGRGLTRRTLNVLAVAFGLGALLITLLLAASSTSGPQEARLLASTAVPSFILWGQITFQLFFNVVDMQCWQQIAANEDVEPKTRETWSAIGASIIRASIYLLWFPALGGTLLGCIMRLASGVDQNHLFPAAFSLVVPGGGEITHGILLGLLLLAFLSTSMSTVDSLLMSALQTMTYDLFARKRIADILASPNRHSRKIIEQEEAITSRARSLLVPMAVAIVVVFYSLYLRVENNVLLLQPLMYSIPLCLLTPALLALYVPNSINRWVAGGAFWGVTLGIVVGLVMVAGLYLPDQAALALSWFGISTDADSLTNWLPCLMPLATNLVSFVCVLIGLAIGRLRSPVL